ncbi:MAG: ABC transporter substrate-binding protein, partial [bacterium]
DRRGGGRVSIFRANGDVFALKRRSKARAEILLLALTIVFIALGLLAAPFAAEGQPAQTIHRLGVLFPGSPPDGPGTQAFLQTMRERGYVEGRNLIVERRYAGGKLERLPDLAAELVGLKVDIILASSAAIPAASRATRTIPIVMTFAVEDPVEAGYARTLARPGGNITGITLLAPELGAKRLELMREVLPRLSLVGVLSWPGAGSAAQVAVVKRAAGSLGIRIRVLEIQEASQYTAAFATLKREGVGALLVLSSSVFLGDRRRIIELATQHGLALMAPFRQFAEDGGLMAYGPNTTDLLGRRIPDFVERIFKGAAPGDLPVEQPTHHDLVINGRTAKALRLKIPPSLLVRADQVIE